MKRSWRVWLAQGAERDFFSILHWTTERFGERQARVYETTLRSALKELANGPGAVGSRARPELGADVFSLHVSRKGRKGKHFVIFRKDNRGQTTVYLGFDPCPSASEQLRHP